MLILKKFVRDVPAVLGFCIIFGICLLDSLRASVQPNWPAPAYFTFFAILTAASNIASRVLGCRSRIGEGDSSQTF